MQKLRLGISTCLLGERVRYDGQHKLDQFLVETLGQYVDYVPVCPEVEAGFAIPREAFRLIGDPDHPRMITVRTHLDVTERMENWARKRVEELHKEDLQGFIFKSKSPSSGMARVKVYPGIEGGMPVSNGVGIFARMFMQSFPLLPVEEEGRLHDMHLRDNFIERIFVLKRWRDMLATNRGALVDFHTRHKLLIMAHNQEAYRRLGRIAATSKGRKQSNVFEEYHAELMKALAYRATRAKHTNVLQHMMGYFKQDLSADEKQELLDLIHNYRQGDVPLIVPMTLLGHYVRKYRKPYLTAQLYLHPHPMEMQLRNHV